MKNIGTLVRKHNVKPTLNLLYIVPAVVLLAGIAAIAVAMSKVPAQEHTYYYVGMVLLAILAIILLAARAANLPKYSFERYENGLKIIYRKAKTPDESYVFDDITEIWNCSTNGGKHANHLAFKTSESDYKLISPKYVGYKSLMRNLSESYLKDILPNKSTALMHGDRLVFPMLEVGGEQVLVSEKSIVPYLQKSQKRQLSVDRFSLFDGLKTYALADIERVEWDKSSEHIVVRSIAGNVLYTQSYFAICNADLFLKLSEEITMRRAEKPEQEI